MSTNLESKLKSAVRDVPNFPRPGIIFKDITPILQDHLLCREITDAIGTQVKHLGIDAIAGIESRGFLFGMMLAGELQLPFVPVRKKGKLPYQTLSESYQLEYGEAEIEIHTDAFVPGCRVLIHDDLLATGGTALAAANLIKKSGAEVAAFSFLIELEFLNGRTHLQSKADEIFSLIRYH
jgi:adenine phosphoribosyltransferase